jgi:hypothetical protein
MALVKQSKNQTSPEDMKSSTVSSNKNEGGSSMKVAVSVDLGDGKHCSPDQKK